MPKFQRTRLIAVFSGFIFFSCSSTKPPGSFWLRYEKQFINESIVCSMPSNAGESGYISIRWQCGVTQRFSISDVQQFAMANGWTILNQKPFSPVTHSLTIPHKQRHSKTEPSFLPIESTLFTLDSGWKREPWMNTINFSSVAYIQIASDGSRLCVFHFWGQEV